MYLDAFVYPILGVLKNALAPRNILIGEEFLRVVPEPSVAQVARDSRQSRAK